MTLTDTIRANITIMMANGGRFVAGNWRSINAGITINCKDGTHDKCHGWILPMGGPNECSCPCHDDHRPDYAPTLATTVKATNWWRIGDLVTIAGSDAPYWKIKYVCTRFETVDATDANGQSVHDIAFSDLELFCH